MIKGKHQKIKIRLYISFIGQNNMTLQVKPRGFPEAKYFYDRGKTSKNQKKDCIYHLLAKTI